MLGEISWGHLGKKLPQCYERPWRSLPSLDRQEQMWVGCRLLPPPILLQLQTELALGWSQPERTEKKLFLLFCQFQIFTWKNWKNSSPWWLNWVPPHFWTSCCVSYHITSLSKSVWCEVHCCPQPSTFLLIQIIGKSLLCWPAQHKGIISMDLQ